MHYYTSTDANEVMGLVKRRFPQAQLVPHTSEDDMINEIKIWRRNYTNTLKDFFEVNAKSDRILRFDTCVNGFGMYAFLCKYKCMLYINLYFVIKGL